MTNGPGVNLLWILACLLACAGASGEPVFSAPAVADSRPRIALIIDDLGYLLRNGDRVVALDGPVACAILPHTPHAARVAERAHAVGKEILLHLPLQPVMQFEATAAGTIRIDMTRDQMLRILAIDLAAIPNVIGVNNHQGSLLTQHPGHMDWLMGELQNRGNLFFVDSFTSESSVALQIAREHGVPSIRRDVFLDHTPTTAAIDSEFTRLKQLAAAHGVAVGIGHPYDVTLDYLERVIPVLADEGIELVPVTVAITAAKPPAIRTASMAVQGAGP